MKMIHWTALLAAALTVVSCQSSKEETKERDALRVVVEKVSATSSNATRTYVGQVEERESIVMSFTGTGAIRQMLVDEGQHVKKGQLVAVMDEEQSRNTLANARASLQQAKDAYERLKQVHEAGSLPEQQWVEVESKLDQAKATEAMALKMLADCRLTAPVSGVIGTVSLRAGETALPTQPVCTVLDISSVKVKASVPEAEIAGIGSKTPTLIDVKAAGAVNLRGGEIEKGVQADALTRTYTIKVNMPNADERLLPGMVASVKMDNGSSEALTLPVMAVQQAIDGSRFVWIVKDGKAVRHNVEVGDLQGNRVEIRSGLDDGNQVIVDGYQKVSEGQKVVF